MRRYRRPSYQMCLGENNVSGRQRLMLSESEKRLLAERDQQGIHLICSQLSVQPFVPKKKSAPYDLFALIHFVFSLRTYIALWLIWNTAGWQDYMDSIFQGKCWPVIACCTTPRSSDAYNRGMKSITRRQMLSQTRVKPDDLWNGGRLLLERSVQSDHTLSYHNCSQSSLGLA